MKYRRFGKTEMMLSVFSMGGMRFIPPNVDAEQMEAVVMKGLEYGINHIETARGYKLSEELLGGIMHKLPRDQLYITTKITPQDDEETMWRFINESLEKMKIEWIDNFDIHGINTFDIFDPDSGFGRLPQSRGSCGKRRADSPRWIFHPRAAGGYPGGD